MDLYLARDNFMLEESVECDVMPEPVDNQSMLGCDVPSLVELDTRESWDPPQVVSLISRQSRLQRVNIRMYN